MMPMRYYMYNIKFNVIIIIIIFIIYLFFDY